MKVYKANKGKKKISALAICLLLTVVMAVGGTLAYLFSSTTPVENTFTPARVGNYVAEEFGTIKIGEKQVEAKQNVTIQNAIRLEDGTITTTDIVDAYIRATIIVTWRSEDGTKIQPAVMGSDYGLNLATDGNIPEAENTKWFKYDDDYYYTVPVKPGEHTGVLVYTALPMVEKDGYTLHVEIVSQSIQAEGTNAKGEKPVQLAWGVTIAEGSVTAYTPRP